MTRTDRMTCPHCGKEFRRDSELKHMRRYHPDVDLRDRTRTLAAPVGSGEGRDRVIVCPRPGCTAKMRQCRLTRHLRQAHGEVGSGRGRTAIDTQIVNIKARLATTPTGTAEGRTLWAAYHRLLLTRHREQRKRVA